MYGDSYYVSATPVVLQPGARVTVAVPPGERRLVALAYTARAERGRLGLLHRFSSAQPAVTFEGCRDRVANFLGGLIATGPRCAALDFYLGRESRPVRRTIALGPGSCGRASVPRGGGGAPYLSIGDAYMGVACSKPNSIACDRIGLAVWLPRRPARLTAFIAGRKLTLHDGGLAYPRGRSGRATSSPPG